MLVYIVAGARPNFMKVSPILKAFKKKKIHNKKLDYKLIHTGQHYDYNMSGSFFEQLEIQEPDIFLNVGSGTQAEQTALVMISFEKTLIKKKPDLVIVVGDVNSTMACTISAKKMGVPVAHVEAGIRSYDISMPEEINRIVTDSIADYFFTTTENAKANLLKHNVSSENIFFVGNTMIDTLNFNLKKIKKPSILLEKKIINKKYFLVTLHRPSNVDDFSKLKQILNQIEASCREFKIIFPVHPRTKKNLSKNNYKSKKIILTDPFGYHEFIYLTKNSSGVITDSGGVTEEATVLSIPCITLRNSTERPETVSIGTNELVGDNLHLMKKNIKKIIDGKWKDGGIPNLWDGKTAERIVDIVNKIKI